MANYVFEPAFELADEVCCEMIDIVNKIIRRTARNNEVRSYYAECALHNDGNTMLFAQTMVLAQAMLACFGNKSRVEQSMVDAAESAVEFIAAQHFAQNAPRNIRLDRDIEDGIDNSLSKLAAAIKEMRRYIDRDVSLFDGMTEREATSKIGRPFSVTELRSTSFGRQSDRGGRGFGGGLGGGFGGREEARREGPVTMSSLRSRVENGEFSRDDSKQSDSSGRNKYYNPAPTTTEEKPVQKEAAKPDVKLPPLLKKLFDELDQDELKALENGTLNLTDAKFETQRLVFNAWVPSEEQTHIPFPRAGVSLKACISNNLIYITEVPSMNELDHRPPAAVGFRAPVRPEEIADDTEVTKKKPTSEEIVVEIDANRGWVFEPSVEAAQTNVIIDRPIWKKRAGRVVDGQYRLVRVMTVLCLSPVIKSALTTNIQSASAAELCKNFKTVYALAASNPGMRGDHNQLTKLNKALTRRTNDFIHYNLSIPTITLTSFEEDAVDLIPHFVNKGLAYAAQAIEKFLRDILVNTFTFVTDEEAAAIHGLGSVDEFSKNDIEVSVRNVAVIDVSASLQDLGLERLITSNSFIVNAHVFDDTIGHRSEPVGDGPIRLRPGVAGIAEYVFSDDMTEVLRIITKDNDIIELMPSVTKTSYVLRLVD